MHGHWNDLLEETASLLQKRFEVLVERVNGREEPLRAVHRYRRDAELLLGLLNFPSTSSSSGSSGGGGGGSGGSGSSSGGGGGGDGGSSGYGSSSKVAVAIVFNLHC